MQEQTVMVDTNVEALVAEAIDLRRAVRDAEVDAEDHERRAATSREAAQMRRLELGRVLVRARALWPRSGPKAKGWGDYLRQVEIDEVTAWRYVEMTRSGASYPQDFFQVGQVKEIQPAPMPPTAEGLGAPPAEPDGVLLPAEPKVDRDTWCTPKWITDALGEVDLDPCANDRSHVQALETYRLDHGQDGLDLAVAVAADARVFVNPPYSDVRPWIDAYKHTRFCFLLKLDPSTKWFAALFEVTALVLIPRGTRVEFESASRRAARQAPRESIPSRPVLCPRGGCSDRSDRAVLRVGHQPEPRNLPVTKKSNRKTNSKPEQLKIEGTGRIDTVPEVEKQAEKFRDAKEERQEMQEAEEAEQLKLTELMKKHGLTTYAYEDREGTKREVYIPLEARAKVRKLKVAQSETDAE